MSEKAGLASNQDYGKDEKSCQKLLAKHNALITDVDSYGLVIEELAAEGRQLIENKHFDSAAIQTRQVCTVKTRYLLHW
jgi:beta-galactosidase GanA